MSALEMVDGGWLPLADVGDEIQREIFRRGLTADELMGFFLLVAAFSEIWKATVAELTDESPDEVLERLQQQLHPDQ